MLLLIPTIQVIAVGHACGTTRFSHSCCGDLISLFTSCFSFKAENDS